MILQENQVQPTITKLKSFAQTYDTVFWLESCNLPNAHDIGAFELVIGLGEKSKIELTSTDFSWDAVSSYLDEQAWKFFALSYDLKNEISKLETKNKDVLNWPVLSCVKPELTITLSKNNEFKVYGVSEAELFKLLDTVNEKDSKPIVTFSAISASLTEEEHHQRVRDIKREISEGNMYEMNLCLEHVLEDFECKQPFELFHKLTRTSPTPFSAYVQLNHKHVLCASPERFLTTLNNRVYSQPIKGTSKRYENFAQNQESRLHLANSIKERAEHIMIVDLVRNDLSKLCKVGSIQVDELFEIYGYKHVNQMISTISGELESSPNFVEAIKATYPMGSMTGAPKHIVMKFIDALETAARGWYSGTIGYIQPDGNFDSNVVIRSLLYDSEKRVAKFSVGGAITFDSDPTLEYEECLLKSEAIRSVLDITA